MNEEKIILIVIRRFTRILLGLVRKTLGDSIEYNGCRTAS